MINEQFKFEDRQLNFKKLKPKFSRFQGQFDLEDQGQGKQFSNSPDTHGSSLKIKFKTPQKLSCSEGITQTTTQTTMQTTTEPNIICLPPVRGGGIIELKIELKVFLSIITSSATNVSLDKQRKEICASSNHKKFRNFFLCPFSL